MVEVQGGGIAVPDTGGDAAVQPVLGRKAELMELGDLLDEGRSSSLSELEDGADEDDIVSANPVFSRRMDVDSEAETERLDNSPQKNVNKKEHETGPTTFVTSPSKVAQSEVPQTTNNDASSDSAVSSLGSTGEDLESETRSVPSAASDPEDNRGGNLRGGSPRKRKLFDAEDGVSSNAIEAEPRQRRRLTQSARSDREDESVAPSREPTVEPVGDVPDGENILNETSSNAHGIPKAKFAKGARPKNGKAKGRKVLKGILEEGGDRERITDLGAGEVRPETDDEHRPDGEDEDTEAAAKDEEEYAKKMAAMESLAALERHFAVLRDRLYDERIVSLNEEIARLSAPKPSHPGYLRQLECIQKYRDDKFESEQKLLVYKIKSLKTKSVAQRSQIHSAYFQTVRDVREKHLDQIGERLSRLRRDHAKTDEKISNYSISFPNRRSTQIHQQTSYNKEVSILSGVAKYVGFPTAPIVVSAQQAEMDEDMEKMGITVNNTKNQKSRPTKLGRSTLSAALSRPAAEEQFLEQNPWANPHHPVHQQHMGRLSRQVSDHTQVADTAMTPAAQKSSIDPSKLAGSASTIPERLSAQGSSAQATPFTDGDSAQRSTVELMAKGKGQRQVTTTDHLHQQKERSESLSPTETRRNNGATHDPGQRKFGLVGGTTNTRGSGEAVSQTRRPPGLDPFDPRNRQGSLSRHGGLLSEVDGRFSNASHLGLHQSSRENNIAPATGLSRIGAR